MTDMQADDETKTEAPPLAPNQTYEVGYRKPPKQHQFKPGQSGNPRGRQKGSRNGSTIVKDALFGQVTAHVGSKIQTMTALEGILKKMISKALAGDSKATVAVLAVAQKQGLLSPEENDTVNANLSDADQAILNDYARRLKEEV